MVLRYEDEYQHPLTRFMESWEEPHHQTALLGNDSIETAAGGVLPRTESAVDDSGDNHDCHDHGCGHEIPLGQPLAPRLHTSPSAMIAALTAARAESTGGSSRTAVTFPSTSQA